MSEYIFYIIGAIFLLMTIGSGIAFIFTGNNYILIIFCISALLFYYDLSSLIELNKQSVKYRHEEAMKDLEIKHTQTIYDMIYSSWYKNESN